MKQLESQSEPVPAVTILAPVLAPHGHLESSRRWSPYRLSASLLRSPKARGTDAAFDVARAEVKLSVQVFLKSRHPAWNLVGRVHFNLAENRNDDEAPFAFLATCTTRLSTAPKGATPAIG